MRKTILATAIIGALGIPTVVLADDAPAASPFTGNFTIASEYLYRGIAQTRGNPAIQGGFDYTHSSGLYIGTWGSNVSWIDDTYPDGASASLELDIYGGYRGTVGPLGFDVGVLTYNYPGHGTSPDGWVKPDTTEIYGALSWQWLTVKYSHSTTALFGWLKSPDFTSKTTGSGYLELNAAYDLGGGWGISGHVGHQKVNGYSDASYSDYKIGATKDVGFGVVGLAVSGTNAKDDCGNAGTTNPYCQVLTGTSDGYSAGKTRLVLTFGKTF